MRQTPNVLEVQERAQGAKFGGARISPAARAAKNVDSFVCLSVCLSVSRAFERQSLRVRFRHERVVVQKRF